MKLESTRKKASDAGVDFSHLNLNSHDLKTHDSQISI